MVGDGSSTPAGGGALTAAYAQAAGVLAWLGVGSWCTDCVEHAGSWCPDVVERAAD